MFTYEKKVRALQLYEQTHSVTETIRILDYPERATLYRWISEKGQPEKVRSTKRGENTPDHPRHPSVEVKLQVLHRCFEHGEDVKSVSEEIGYSRASIYNWRRKYLQRGRLHSGIRQMILARNSYPEHSRLQRILLSLKRRCRKCRCRLIF